MVDMYCRVCGEPWDLVEVVSALKGEEDALTKEEAEMVIRGKGCPSCGGEKPLYCRGCGIKYTRWVIEEFASELGVDIEDIKSVVIHDKKCIECMGGLEYFNGEELYYDALIDADGEVEIL